MMCMLYAQSKKSKRQGKKMMIKILTHTHLSYKAVSENKRIKKHETTEQAEGEEKTTTN